MIAPLKGLVLAGGRSTRMGFDKALCVYEPSGKTQEIRVFEALSQVCEHVWVSRREGQARLQLPEREWRDDPKWGDIGPAAGILTAHEKEPSAAWLVFAIDFPHADVETLLQLVQARNPHQAATVFVNEFGILEPLLAIWEPSALIQLSHAPEQGARRTLEQLTCQRVIPKDARILRNVNNPDEVFT